MLALSNQLIDIPVMSLQTGSELARTSQAIIDPRNLTIIALYVNGPQIIERPSILHVSDIREVSDLGFIVDDSQALMDTSDLVRLQSVIDFEFEPIGMPVYEEHGSKLGKINDYAFEPSSFMIKQLYNRQSFFKNITTASNIISREQIVAITKDKIVVKSTSITETVREKANAATQFVNPFRQPGQAEPTQTTHH